MKGFRQGAVVALAFFLAACGGGGGGGAVVGSSSSGFPAQGIAKGTTNLGYPMILAILENGEYYNMTLAANLALTVDHGTLSASTYNFFGNVVEFNVATNATSTATLSGLFVPQGAINGTNVFNLFQISSFSASYQSSYTTAASLSALSGTYSGPYYYGGPTITLAFSSIGAMTGTSTNCAISGTATPRPAGTNVFDVSLTLTGANCTPSGVGSASGVAILETLNGTSTLYLASINAAGTAGFFLAADKQ